MSDVTTKKTDYELVTDCLAGNWQCFDQLIARYKNLVFSVVLRMVVDRDEAEDLAQEVFIKIYKKLNLYHPEYAFSTWTMRITTNHVIDYRRKKRQETVSLEDVAHAVGTTDSPEAVVIAYEERRGLRHAIDALPDMYKVPIVLYHQQGMSYQEISDIIEEPLSKVKNRIFRGRKLLKESLIAMGEGGQYGLC